MSAHAFSEQAAERGTQSTEEKGGRLIAEASPLLSTIMHALPPPAVLKSSLGAPLQARLLMYTKPPSVNERTGGANRMVNIGQTFPGGDDAHPTLRLSSLLSLKTLLPNATRAETCMGATSSKENIKCTCTRTHTQTQTSHIHSRYRTPTRYKDSYTIQTHCFTPPPPVDGASTNLFP